VINTVDFIFDFASPNAYFVHQVVPRIEARTGARFNYIPCLLGGIFRATGNQAPMITYANVPSKTAYDLLESKRFMARHNITRFTMNPHFPVNTLLVMRGALVAEMDGQLKSYIDVVLRHMWEEPKNMSDPNVAAAALSASGFDGHALLARTQDETVKAKLIANTDAAIDRGAFGVPTFYVGDQMFFGKERLGQVEELLVTASAETHDVTRSAFVAQKNGKKGP
jgi:2-hydroxychromene-2-carboxylate isomerase